MSSNKSNKSAHLTLQRFIFYFPWSIFCIEKLAALSRGGCIHCIQNILRSDSSSSSLKFFPAVFPCDCEALLACQYQTDRCHILLVCHIKALTLTHSHTHLHRTDTQHTVLLYMPKINNRSTRGSCDLILNFISLLYLFFFIKHKQKGKDTASHTS